MELDRIPFSAGDAELAVGNARHDSIDRIYLRTATNLITGNDVEIIEYTSVGGSNWEKAVIAHLALPSPSIVFRMLPAHQGRLALYFTSSGGDFYEVFFDGAQWRQTLVTGLLSPYPRSCAGGKGRNDGVYRINCVSPLALEELTPKGDGWLRTQQISVDQFSTLQNLESVAIGPARNDGHQRVYVQTRTVFSGAGSLFELTYKSLAP
jgi:hypothetical protein